MSANLLRFYAIPPALLLVVPVISLVVVLASHRRSAFKDAPERSMRTFLPIFSLSLLSLLTGAFGLTAVHEAQLASIEAVLLTLLRLELAAFIISLISNFNRHETIPRTQLWTYNILLSLLLVGATITSFISTFLPQRVTPLIPPFFHLLFTTLTLPLLVYMYLAPTPEPPALPEDDSPPISPITPCDFDTPPPSPSSTKRSFGIHHMDHSYPSIPRQPTKGLSVQIPIRFPSARDTPPTPNRVYSGSRRELLGLLLVVQVASLLVFAFEICITVLVPDLYADIPRRLRQEVQAGVWKTSVTLRCFQSVLTVIACGCMMVVWKARLSRVQEPPMSPFVPPSTPHRWAHRRQLSTTSSFCSPGIRTKSPVFPIPTHRPETPMTPAPTPRSRSSQIFSGIRGSIHSYIQSEPRLPGRIQFPTLPIRLPTRRAPCPRRVPSPHSPPMDAFNMHDPFAPPSPRALPRYNVHASQGGSTTRLSAWGTLTLPVPGSHTSPPKNRRGGSNGVTAIVEEARLAEKLLERLDSESSSAESR